MLICLEHSLYIQAESVKILTYQKSLCYVAKFKQCTLWFCTHIRTPLSSREILLEIIFGKTFHNLRQITLYFRNTFKMKSLEFNFQFWKAKARLSRHGTFQHRLIFSTCFSPYLAMIICHAGTEKCKISGKKYPNIGVSHIGLPWFTIKQNGKEQNSLV